MKLIQLPHKVSDYSCPTNGIEDLYEWKTGVRLPGYALMDLGMLGFMYIRQKQAPVPRMVFWGSGTGRPLHEYLSDVVGYRWHMSEGGGLKPALNAAKASVDAGMPVILGLLDMYHLPYFDKMYHRMHIPQHYVLMVGYDDDRDVVYVQDNSRPDVQALPVSDLRSAWDVHVPGQGKKNTYCILTFDPKPASFEDILRKGLKKRANWMFNPPVGFMGLPGLRKLTADFARWTTDLDQCQLKASLEHLAMFTSSVVPMPPARLLPFTPQNPDPHQALRGRVAVMLEKYAREYDEPGWEQASQSFRTGGEQIGLLTDRVVDALLGQPEALNEVPAILGRIAVHEEAAFRALLG